MSPPPAPNEEARSWLRVAARDLELANLAMQNEPPFTGEALYHARQAAEKALKGFLLSCGVTYPMTRTFASCWNSPRISIRLYERLWLRRLT